MVATELVARSCSPRPAFKTLAPAALDLPLQMDCAVLPTATRHMPFFPRAASLSPRATMATYSPAPHQSASWVQGVSPRMSAPFNFFVAPPAQTKGPFYFHAEPPSETVADACAVPPQERLADELPVLLGRLRSNAHRELEQNGEPRESSASPVLLKQPQSLEIHEIPTKAPGRVRNLTPESSCAPYSEPCTPFNIAATCEPRVEEYVDALKRRNEELEKTNMEMDALQKCLEATEAARERERVAAEKAMMARGAEAEQLRQHLDTCVAERDSLVAAQVKFAAAEKKEEEERCRLKACFLEETASARQEIEHLQMRLSEVESERMQIASDKAQLQQSLEALQDSSHDEAVCNASCTDRAEELRVHQEHLAAYEERIRGHEFQLAQKETNFNELRIQLAKVEAERDREQQSNEKLLQKQSELVEAAQYCGTGGDTAIHQFKDFKTVRGFRFKTLGRVHKVEIAHQEGIWQLAVDGEVVRTLAHKVYGTIFKREEYSLDASVAAPDGREAKIVARMLWRTRQWKYQLVVNGTEVPACWKRARVSGPGFWQTGVEAVEVMREAELPTASH